MSYIGAFNFRRRELPSEYTQVEYIESTGTQYIDTGFKPNQDTRVVMEAVFPITPSASAALFGIMPQKSNDFLVFYYPTKTTWGFRHGASGAQFLASDILPIDRAVFDFNKNSLTIGSDSASATYKAFTSTDSMYLMCSNNSGTPTYMSALKLYSCQIYDDGALVRDYVPCVNSNRVAGLYDLVENKFYSNAGTGQFICIIPRTLPEGYTQVEYIESTGTQYITTDYYPKYNTKLVIDVSDYVLNQWTSVYGVRATNSATAPLQFALDFNEATTIRMHYFGTNQTATVTDTTLRTTIIHDANVCTAFGAKMTCTSVSSGELTYPLMLFAFNQVGTANSKGSFKCYSCQIYEGGIIVRDYVPCTNQTGVCGLYDVVNKKFYSNSGTGTFAVGDRLGELARKSSKIYIGIESFTPRDLPSDYTQVEYIESTGTQYIDTGVEVTSSNYNTIKFSYDAQMLDTSGAEWAVSGTGIGNKNQMYIGTNSGKIYYGLVSGDKDTGVAYDYTRRVWTYDAKNAKVSVSGLCEVSMTDLAAPTVTKNLHLFAYANSAGNQTCHKERHWSSQVWVNDVLVRDYVPCINSSSEVGLYDLVENKFYSSGGTDSFTAGSSESVFTARKVKKAYVGIKQFELRELPEGYTQVEYIESSGTQYVDTGFAPNNNTRIESDIVVTTGGTSFLFGARNNSSANATSNSFSMPQISGTSLRSDYGSVESSISISPVQRLKIDKNKNVTTINGTTVTATTQTFSCTYNLVLLAVNTAGTISAKISAKLYACRIYDNGTLIRDYVPCTNQTGVGGLYDLVENKFYPNNGTGEFITGTSECISVARLCFEASS